MKVNVNREGYNGSTGSTGSTVNFYPIVAFLGGGAAGKRDD